VVDAGTAIEVVEVSAGRLLVRALVAREVEPA
jgi:hypothetical protein